MKNLKEKDNILFLIWPRQAWKTTLLKSLMYFNYIDENQVLFFEWRALLEKWIVSYEDFIGFLSLKYELSSIKYLIIDEAQIVPRLGDILFSFINEIRRGKYDIKLIISGSWSLQIFKNITDSLVGRKKIIYVYPFDFEEFLLAKWVKYFFSDSKVVIQEYLKLWEEYALFGGYPKVVLTQDKRQKIEILEDIYASFLEKDIKILLKDEQILNLKKILYEVAKRITSQVSFADIVESAGVKRYEFEKITFILENTFILKSVKPLVTWKFEKEVKKKEKIYFVDLWILRLILDYLKIDDLNKSLIVENFVFSQLLYDLPAGVNINFWWKYNEVEIDFVLKDLALGKIIAVDSKITKKDNIPKRYLNFCEIMKKDIEKFIITTTDLVKTRKEKCLFEFLPFVFAKKIMEK